MNGSLAEAPFELTNTARSTLCTQDCFEFAASMLFVQEFAALDHLPEVQVRQKVVEEERRQRAEEVLKIQAGEVAKPKISQRWIDRCED